VKPSSAARLRIISRLAAVCSRLDPYFWAICSTMFCPPAGMVGLSSKGWNLIFASTRSPVRASASSRPRRPMMHHGQDMSETKSIFMGRGTSASFRKQEIAI